VGDCDKEELDAEMRGNNGVRRKVIIKNSHLLELISGSK
jgi:hypothetical protein